MADDHAVLSLATAVVLRAFEDLEHYNPTIRHDAFMFLTERLWNPACLWFQILDPLLIRDRVVPVVYRRLEQTYRKAHEKSPRKGGATRRDVGSGDV